MRNIKLLLRYDGTRYQGWQNQKNTDNTIETKLETLLSRMTGEKIEVSASGRTDAGVHAKNQVGNFKTKTNLSCEEILAQCNEFLPQDIAVLEVTEAPERFHSRLNAKGKTYSYHIWTSPIPPVFERNYVYHFPKKLDVSLMEKGASHLLGSHDFQSFCSTKPGKKSTVRSITDIEIKATETGIHLRFTGNGFLYHMVRIMVGTLIEIGLGERDAEALPSILEAKERSKAGFLAPASGLFLEEVYYEEKDL